MEDAADARFAVPYNGPYGELRKRESGPMDRLAEPVPTDAWGKELTEGYSTVMPGIVQKEFDLVLNPDEELAQVMVDLISEAEVRIQHHIPLMWRSNGNVSGHPKVLVQGPPSRLAMFEEIYNKQNQPTRNGWIKRYLDDFRTDVEWLRVVWLPSSEPAPKGCDMAGCEHGFRTRWAIAYTVPCEGSYTPTGRDLYVYCQQSVMADNDVATFIPEGK